MSTGGGPGALGLSPHRGRAPRRAALARSLPRVVVLGPCARGRVRRGSGWLLPSELSWAQSPDCDPGRCWVPRKRGAQGLRAGSSPSLDPRLFRRQPDQPRVPRNEKAQWNLPNSSGSQPRRFRPRGASRAWGSGWHLLESGPLSILRPFLSHLPPFLVPRGLVCSNCAPRGCVGLGGGAALEEEVGKR